MGKGRNAFEIALCSSIVAFFPPFPKAFPSMGGGVGISAREISLEGNFGEMFPF